MPIPLENDTKTGNGLPVLQRRSIGETYVGGIIKFETRDDLKDGQPQVKENGKHKQEMVVHLLTREATMQAGLGGEYSVPERGSIVRAILSKGAFGQWIEAKDAMNLEAGRGLQVGDMFYMDTTHYEKFATTGGYNSLGNVSTNEELAALRQSPEWANRQVNAGGRGQLKLRAATGEETSFVTECETAHGQLTAIPLEDSGPFDNQAPAPAAGGSIPF